MTALNAPNTYYAPKPTPNLQALRTYYFTRILFPPLLVWDALKYASNFLSGWLLGRLIVRAQNKNKQPREVPISEECLFDRFAVNTHDGASLDTLVITPTSLGNSDMDHPIHVINFMGQAGRFDAYDPRIAEYVHVKAMVDDAKMYQCKVIGFNYRGVGGSAKKGKSAWSKSDLVIDGIAQVQRLLDKGVPPHKIALKGFSLGGAIATLVASHFHNRGINIYLFSDRSFSSITNVIVGRLQSLGAEPGQQPSFLMNIISWIAKPIINFFLLLTDWEINAESAFKSISNDFKEYIVVRSSKERRRQFVNKDDTIIPHYASMHACLKYDHRAAKYKIDRRIQVEENSDECRILIEQRAVFKARKMHTTHPSEEGHDVPFITLKNRYGVSAPQFFGQFLEKMSQQDHESTLSKVP